MIITDKDPLPIYGFIIAGTLVLIILLNSMLGTCLAGWRSPKTGRATARRPAAMSETTLHSDDAAGNRAHMKSGGSAWGNSFDNDTLSKVMAMNGSIGRNTSDGNGGNDRGMADVASRSSYYSDDGDTLGNGTIINEGVTGGGSVGNGGSLDGGMSRYAVLREWGF
ncbi:hypothetical protein QBC37DRAFT_376687 [Rhypophila decipiens]|uniref:Uncharacterized protein n=1 Tax=Rhypophila decipiens TaxID=261697 RepID=A0AAN6Y1P9_9PEZI|nr:hypothetical protein QBC37DRAFT_376687 [Rhypophila decipiens]